MIRVLFCGLQYDYGRVERGYSFEYLNLYNALEHMDGVVASFFPVDVELQTYGRDEMNRRLLAEVLDTKPDVLFCFLFTNELQYSTIDFITRRTKTKTFNWFADDHWRFPIFSRLWAPLFTLVSTTDSFSVEKYKSLGIPVILSQWAANPALYHPVGAPSGEIESLVFVGQNHGTRSKYYRMLLDEHLPVGFFGKGWPNGRVSQDKMVQMFSNAAINLNFADSYGKNEGWMRTLGKLLIRKEQGQYRFVGHNLWYNIVSMVGGFRKQIKGRVFEVPACGGFLLTEYVQGLENYFDINTEVATFSSTSELIDKARYYFMHPEVRQRMATAGKERVLREHTYAHRFKAIFNRLNL